MAVWPTEWPPFLWGAATSSHQIEGGQVNDWTRWEESGRGTEPSGRAAGHWELWESDFDLLSELGHNSYRFSIEWSRINPQPDVFDRTALAQYRQMAERLRALHIVPLLTLHHFTLPQWAVDRGGFLNPDASEWFTRYVDQVMDALGDQVDLYVTINEPMVLVVMGYLMGMWPPGVHGFRRAFKLIRRLAEVHRAAYDAIKAKKPTAWVGLAHHFIAFHPWQPTPWDRATTDLMRYLMNNRFPRMVEPWQDFIGINYYTRQYGHWSKGLHPIQSRSGTPLSDLGWEIYPEGLREVLDQVAPYQKPILITENGIATTNDAVRIQYLKNHLKTVERAQLDGLPVRGYFHWSFMDNFEWAEGFGPRFGLVAIDYDTLERTPRPSAAVYREIIRANQGLFPINVP